MGYRNAGLGWVEDGVDPLIARGKYAMNGARSLWWGCEWATRLQSTQHGYLWMRRRGPTAEHIDHLFRLRLDC